MEPDDLELEDWYWLLRWLCWLPQDRDCACDSMLDLFWLQLLEADEVLGDAPRFVERCCDAEVVCVWACRLELEAVLCDFGLSALSHPLPEFWDQPPSDSFL